MIFAVALLKFGLVPGIWADSMYLPGMEHSVYHYYSGNRNKSIHLYIDIPPLKFAF